MGYAGYTKAKLPPPPPSAVQAALWAVQSQDTLTVIEKLTKNVAVNPTGVLLCWLPQFCPAWVFKAACKIRGIRLCWDRVLARFSTDSPLWYLQRRNTSVCA